MAAISYGNDINEQLIANCLENKYRLDIWMRYDHTVPVAVPLLKKLLKHYNDKNNQGHKNNQGQTTINDGHRNSFRAERM